MKNTPQRINTKSHLLHFGILILLVIIGTVAIRQSAHQPLKQMAASWLLSLGYISWGIWHHSRHGTLYWHVVIEYILLGVLALALTTSILMSS